MACRLFGQEIRTAVLRSNNFQPPTRTHLSLVLGITGRCHFLIACVRYILSAQLWNADCSMNFVRLVDLILYVSHRLNIWTRYAVFVERLRNLLVHHTGHVNHVFLFEVNSTYECVSMLVTIAVTSLLSGSWTRACVNSSADVAGVTRSFAVHHNLCLRYCYVYFSFCGRSGKILVADVGHLDSSRQFLIVYFDMLLDTVGFSWIAFCE